MIHMKVKKIAKDENNSSSDDRDTPGWKKKGSLQKRDSYGLQ